MSVYQFTLNDADQQPVSLAAYQGKVTLIVNTASGCGFTPQYEGLEALYETYKKEGFEILDFPCNQFLNQAPGSAKELESFCQLNFGVTFKNFDKVKVNGKDADPLWTYLREAAPQDAHDEEAGSFKKTLERLKQVVTGNNIKWNFTKFLVDKEGNVLHRFGPTYKPADIAPFIEKALRG